MNNIKNEILTTLKKIVGIYEAEAPQEEGAEQFNKVYSESEIKVSQIEMGGKVELIDGDGNLSDAPDGDYELVNGKKFTVKDSLIVAIEGEEQPEEAPVEEVVEEAAEGVPAEPKFKVGDAIVVKEGNEHDKVHKGLVLTIVEVEGNTYAVALPDGSIHKWYTEEEVEAAPVEEQTPEMEMAAEEVPIADPMQKKMERCMADMEAMKAEIEALKEVIAGLQEAVAGKATKDEMNEFKSQVDQIDANIKEIAKTPVEFSKTNNNNQVKESKEERLMELARILGKK